MRHLTRVAALLVVALMAAMGTASGASSQASQKLLDVSVTLNGQKSVIKIRYVGNGRSSQIGLNFRAARPDLQNVKPRQIKVSAGANINTTPADLITHVITRHTTGSLTVTITYQGKYCLDMVDAWLVDARAVASNVILKQPYCNYTAP